MTTRSRPTAATPSRRCRYCGLRMRLTPFAPYRGRPALATVRKHEDACANKTPAERAFYKKNGRWPPKRRS